MGVGVRCGHWAWLGRFLPWVYLCLHCTGVDSVFTGANIRFLNLRHIRMRKSYEKRFATVSEAGSPATCQQESDCSACQTLRYVISLDCNQLESILPAAWSGQTWHSGLTILNQFLELRNCLNETCAPNDCESGLCVFSCRRKWFLVAQSQPWQPCPALKAPI